MFFLKPKFKFESLKSDHPVFGYMVEYDSMDGVIEAARKTKAAGYEAVEAYSPMPSHELIHVLGHKSYLANLIFCGGCFGATLGFTVQTFANVIHYPWNIGGRPDFSWPPFIIITFELMVLFSALTATFGMILLNGLPRHHHPLFEVEAFERASQDRFFLVIHSGDAKFDMQDTKTFLSGLDPLSLAEVPKV